MHSQEEAIKDTEIEFPEGKPSHRRQGYRMGTPSGRSAFMKEIIKRLAEEHNLTDKKTREVLKSFLDAIADDLAKGTEVRLSKFGPFEVRVRKARTGRNPRTGDKITIAASRFPAFKAAKKLKDKVDAPQDAPAAVPQATPMSTAQPAPAPAPQPEPQPTSGM